MHYPLVLVLLLLTTPAAIIAAEVVSKIEVTFGSVDLHPSGDAVTIDASGGSATPSAGRSVITGGASGSVTFRATASSTSDEEISITYPTSVYLSNGHGLIYVTDIGINSEYNGDVITLPAGGLTDVEVHIGGKLTLPKNTLYGNYSGFLVIQYNVL